MVSGIIVFVRSWGLPTTQRTMTLPNQFNIKYTLTYVKTFGKRAVHTSMVISYFTRKLVDIVEFSLTARLSMRGVNPACSCMDCYHSPRGSHDKADV